MPSYLILAILLQTVVDYLLLLASAGIWGAGILSGRVIMAVLTGGLYTAASLIPGLEFLSSKIWYTAYFITLPLIAYGINSRTPLLGGSYILLRTAVRRLMGEGLLRWEMAFVIGVGILFYLAFIQFGRYVAVELCWGGRKVRMKALRDTGNNLRDPVTGKRVLVVDADVANRLTGLSLRQLIHPVEAMGQVPGLRLIPYHSVGQSGGLMLALSIQNAKIGMWRGNAVVGFAPRILDDKGKYQGLIGGSL